MAEAEPSSMSALQGLRILVAEDESLISMLAEDMLTDAGVAEVVIAASLEEARAILDRELRIDAAVLDVKLGSDSGIDLAGVLEERAIPFVFATGLGPDSDIPAPFAHVAIVQKPYTGDDLIAAISRARQVAR
jgi:CheY-like chemotaxis protein